MRTSKSLTILVFWTILGLVLSACVPAATPTPAPAGPRRGGKVTMAVWQEPATLNWLLGTQTVMNEVNAFVVEGLLGINPDGSYYPVLAREVPTVQNGGVSPDGKTITYKLKEGVLWSDGKPFTCEDVKWTWQVIMTPGIGIVSTTGYSDIEAVECPNPNTVVVKFKKFYAPYHLNLFLGVLPKHATGDPQKIKDWEYNRKPIGTGPFKVQEFVTASHIILVRNENYREKDKPYLDQVIIQH